MTQLSAQSIQKLCTHPGSWDTKPMIHPFLETKTVINGSSAGLSAASYDLRIGHDLTLHPNPAALFAEEVSKRAYGLGAYYALAHTLEDLCIPHNVAAYVIDKSTYARRFLSAFNTYIDPGFQGNLTLELVNFGPEEIYIKAGDPICQLTFHWLDQTTDRPYDGKYNHQPRRAVGPIHEDDEA